MDKKMLIPKNGCREAELDDKSIDLEERTVKLAFMSEIPCENWYTPEVAICNNDSVNMTRMKNGVMPLLFNHDRDNAIGYVQSIEVSESIARAVVKFYNDEEGERVFQKVQQGLRGVSVGYIREAVTRVRAGVEFLGKTYERETDVVTRWQPYEISIVTIPADPTTGVGRGMETSETITVNELDEPKQEEGDDNMDKQKELIAAEQQRTMTIMDLCSKHNVPEEKMRAFIGDGTDVNAVRTYILDEMAGKTTPLNVKVGETEQGNFRKLAVDGLCLRHGVKTDSIAEGAGQYRNLTLRALAEKCLEDAGTSNVRFMSDEELLSKVTAQRAMGSETFVGIIDDFANKTMLPAYNEHPFIFKNFVSSGSNKDFKPTYRYEIGLAGLPELMPQESGEFKYQGMADTKISTQIATYGKGIALTREIFINDQLGEVQQTIALQANGFRRLQEMMFFETLAKVPFTSKNGNLVKTNKNISAEAYDEMSQLMLYQKDLSERGFIGVAPSILIAPPKQVMEHKRLLNSTADPNGAHTGVVNVAQGQYTLYTSPYLDPTGANSAYYVMAAPGQLRGIEFTTLNGVDTVQSRTVVPAEHLGLRIQMWLDFGFNILNPKAFVKNENNA